MTAVLEDTPDIPLESRVPERRFSWRGRPEDAPWVRPALLALLAATAVLYVWDLGASGWANPFYSAAVQAGSESWTAFFFGSSDAANSITVDKTPAALWPMVIAARIFGVNSWSILVPQALMGVAAVGVLYATVRRQFSPGAGLLAGAVLALTPVAALMFRFNNPDALLVLLLTLSAYGMVRAQERGSTRWLVFAGSMIGWAFLAKMLQAFLVVPGFVLVYLISAPVSLGRRLWQLVLAGAAMLVSAGWWVAVVALVPASARPYIGGSQNNSVLELALGYNGLGRITGEEVGGLGNLNQDSGWDRMFGGEIGGQVAWLLPSALFLLVAGLWLTRRAARTDHVRAAFLLWGTWLLVTIVVFSHMQGIFHAYYTVALAPAIGALVGMGCHELWRRRNGLLASGLLAALVAGTAVWAYVLLGRSSDFLPWLRIVILIGGCVAAIGLFVAGRLNGDLSGKMGRRAAVVAATVAVVASLAGPAAYALDTAGSTHTGAIPSAGPSVRGAGLGGGFGGRPGGNFGGGMRPGSGTNAQQPGVLPGNGQVTQGNGQAMQGNGTRRTGMGGGMGRGGGPGGLLNATTPSAELTAALKADARSYTWVAATVGSNNAAGYQLASGEPVMAVGGFNGTDPAPNLERFQQYVEEGKIHYFIGTGMGMRGGGSGSDYAQQIATWVQANFTATTVGGTTVYDLTASS